VRVDFVPNTLTVGAVPLWGKEAGSHSPTEEGYVSPNAVALSPIPQRGRGIGEGDGRGKIEERSQL